MERDHKKFIHVSKPFKILSLKIYYVFVQPDPDNYDLSQFAEVIVLQGRKKGPRKHLTLCHD